MFYEVWQLEMFQPAKVTFKDVQGHSVMMMMMTSAVT